MKKKIQKVLKKSFVMCIALIMMISVLPVGNMQVEAANYTGTDVVNYAKQFVGCSYQLGKYGPDKFDCVGLVKYVYANFGVDLPMGTVNYRGDKCLQYGTKITDKWQLQAGDVIFYGTSHDDVGHAAIYIGNGLMINALNPTYGVCILYMDWEMGKTYNWAETTLCFSSSSFQFAIRVIDGVNTGDGGRIQNNSVANITDTSAKISAKVSPAGNVTEAGFYLGTSPDNMQKTVESAKASSVVSISYDLGTGKWCSALQSGTTYYYQIYAIINGVTYKSTVDSFKTLGTGDTVNTRITNYSVADITDTTAYISAKVSPTGYVTEAGFYIGTSPDNMQKIVEKATAPECIKISYTLGTGKWTAALSKGTTYYYQIYGIVDGITYKSAVDSFTTTGDTQAPSISNVQITDISQSGYTVTCDVTDNVGVTRVCFPTWTAVNDQDDIVQNWYDNAVGSQIGSSNSYSFRVNVAEHNGEGGAYNTHIYAYDTSGNYNCVTTMVVIDLDAPVISNAYVTDVTTDGYTVYCNVADASTIERVSFPSWSEANGGDDLSSDWYNVAAVYQPVNGNTYAYRVNISDHNNEGGSYKTEIYAYDTWGNYGSTSVTTYVGIPITSIALDITNMNLVTGAGKQLTVTSYAPANTTSSKAVTWSTNNAAVATVDSNGYVTAVGPGSATITATAADGSGVSKSCTVTVTQPVTGITLNKTSLSLKPGGTTTLTATVSPSTASNESVTWKSSDTAVATVDSDGKVTAVAVGSATITVTAVDGSGVSNSCTVTVMPLASGITLNKTSLSLKSGEISTLTATILPSDASQAVTWKSNNTAVATVDSNGKVTAVGAGSAIITATATDGSGVSKKCTVTVTASITFVDVEAGSYYESPVQWAVESGITNGYGSTTTFCPDIVCTRGQIVTFLWRAKGCPEPTSSSNPFTDIKETDYYYKAVLWAVEQGITNGYGSDTIFNPNGECTRGQVATFMWRAEGQPANTGNNPFIDLDAGGYYYNAVLWAVEKGVTNGYGSDDIFCPDVACTRGQIVTFLYRGMN